MVVKVKVCFYMNMIMNKKKRRALAAVLSMMTVIPAGYAQNAGQRILTMEDVLQLAQENSISAMSNRNMFAASYWSFRSYKAEMLPSLNLSANMANFNRSLVQLQDYNTGALSYRANYNMSNDATLYVSQNIPWTGGTLSLSTSLSRLDQYSPQRLTTYYAQPVYISYAQNLLGYNRFKWTRKIEPRQYEIAKREYIESMEQVNQTAVMYFWNYVAGMENYERARKSFEESKRLYQAACKRFEMSTITRDELMQVEMSMLNDSLNMNTVTVSLRTSLGRLCSYIGFKEDAELNLQPDYNIPNLTLDYNDVLERALANSSFRLSQEVSYTEAERSVEQARANRGLSASVNARLGISGSDNTFGNAMVQLQDQEVFGVSISIPIVDWGLARGRVRMAEAQAQTTRYSLEQSMADYRQDLLTQVMQFNNQCTQCELSKRAAELAQDSYELALSNFGSGSMTMTQLDLLKEKRDNAWSVYVNNVASYWNCYFGIRRTTLYDYNTGTDINAEFDRLIDK